MMNQAERRAWLHEQEGKSIRQRLLAMERQHEIEQAEAKIRLIATAMDVYISTTIIPIIYQGLNPNMYLPKDD